ncbi:MAG TPA: tetratricopeptide repeat protein, partial [Pyrinomonadaceae bacterium]|nr:tetratricopeptide repeat protein [Pyrinomonadaceae bacterium]
MKRERHSTKKIGIGTIIFVLAGVITAMACAWSYITDHSVRFNSYRTGRGFYRLPPLPIMYDMKTGKELTVAEIDNMEYNEEEEDNFGTSAHSDPLSPKPDDIWEQAHQSEQEGNLAKSETLLKTFLDLTVYPSMDDSEDEWKKQQQYRNSAYDMLDTMTALKQGSTVQSVKSYLDARYAYHTDSTENVEAMIANAPHDKNLRDNWEYLHAALLSETMEKNDALTAFKQHAEKYPHSEKNEAVLYMIAKLTMQSSHSFENHGCGVTGKDEYGRDIDPSKIEPKEKCQDDNWHAAVKDFQQLIQKYPNGRYFNDARGWLAYLFHNGGERALALAEYYRLLGNPTDRKARLDAKKSLQMIGDEYDDETLDQVEKMIADDPDTAMAYAYYRIYNYATDMAYQKSYGRYYDDWQEKQDENKRVADALDAGNHELNRIAHFATSMIKRYPQAKVSSGFVVRVAEAQIELQKYPDALALAKKALNLGVRGDLRAQALWIKGSADHAKKNFKAARATFDQLISEFPDSKLTEGARRLVAMTAEDQGDLEKALEQYLALGYQYDVAYFIDVLMPTDTLAKFVNGHKQIEQHDQLLYALGVRYMRDGKWDDARATFRQVTTEPDDYVDDSENEKQPGFPKDPDWNLYGKPFPPIKSSWVKQDMNTIDALEHLKQRVENAQGDNAKTEAMYQFASYQYDANPLLFYNPAAWQGQRYELLSQLDLSESMRLPNESQIIFDYSKSHDTLARAIPLYLEIADSFPNTKTAQDALYTAAVAQDRLSKFNPYWRSIYEQGLFAGPLMVTYADVKRHYPLYKFPRGTDGWEASTRTVNGGPAYPAPPKPAPKLTRTQKVERILGRVTDKLSAAIRPKVTAFIDATTSFVRGVFYAILAI